MFFHILEISISSTSLAMKDTGGIPPDIWSQVHDTTWIIKSLTAKTIKDLDRKSVPHAWLETSLTKESSEINRVEEFSAN